MQAAGQQNTTTPLMAGSQSPVQYFYFKTLDAALGQLASVDSTSGYVPVPVLPSGVIDFDTSTSTLASSTAETTVYTKQIPRSVFQLNSGLSVSVFADARIDTSARTLIVRTKLNGTTVATLTLTSTASNTSAARFRTEVFIVNNNSLSSQKFLAWMVGLMNNQNVAAGDSNAIQTLR